MEITRVLPVVTLAFLTAAAAYDANASQVQLHSDVLDANVVNKQAILTPEAKEINTLQDEPLLSKIQKQPVISEPGQTKELLSNDIPQKDEALVPEIQQPPVVIEPDRKDILKERIRKAEQFGKFANSASLVFGVSTSLSGLATLMRKNEQVADTANFITMISGALMFTFNSVIPLCIKKYVNKQEKALKDLGE